MQVEDCRLIHHNHRVLVVGVQSPPGGSTDNDIGDFASCGKFTQQRRGRRDAKPVDSRSSYRPTEARISWVRPTLQQWYGHHSCWRGLADRRCNESCSGRIEGIEPPRCGRLWFGNERRHDSRPEQPSRHRGDASRDYNYIFAIIGRHLNSVFPSGAANHQLREHSHPPGRRTPVVPAQLRRDPCPASRQAFLSVVGCKWWRYVEAR